MTSSSFKEALSQLAAGLDEADAVYAEEAEKFWAELTQDQRLMAFYSVIKRVVKGELEDNGSYRYVLYDVFGFDMDSYVIGMACGYMDLHNAIEAPVNKFTK